jgi:hypothetical protein
MNGKMYKIPTKKEFRNNPKNKDACWDDVYARASCEACGKFFQPGDMILSIGYMKGYHKHCIPKVI